MPDKTVPVFLLASPEPKLLAVMEPVLRGWGARVEIVLSAEAALVSMTAAEPPGLALLDVALPGMAMDRLLTAVRTVVSGKRLPIVLISDNVTPEWASRLDEGVVHDLLLRGDAASYWKLRLDQTLRTHRLAGEVEALRETAARNSLLDRLTGVYNRETLLGMLFRETDRAQRMKSALSLVLFDIDDFGHWNSRLGGDACDELLRQAARRTARMLRSYDLLGRAGQDEFMVGLPSCDGAFALSLTERICRTVFGAPFTVGGEAIRLSACFGIASSQGRSPLVVLREAEQALQEAKENGPESIRCFRDMPRAVSAVAAFVSSTADDDFVAW